MHPSQRPNCSGGAENPIIEYGKDVETPKINPDKDIKTNSKYLFFRKAAELNEITAKNSAIEQVFFIPIFETTNEFKGV